MLELIINQQYDGLFPNLEVTSLYLTWPIILILVSAIYQQYDSR